MILFCGYANLDVIVRVPVLPGEDPRLQATSIERMHGGTGANAAVAAARAGARAGFGGALGDGAEDRGFLAQLEADGVDTSWAQTDASISTAVVLVTPDGERVIISQDDALDEERVTRGVRRLLEQRDPAGTTKTWLYLDGYRWPSSAELLRREDPRRVLSVFVDLDGCESPGAARSALEAADHLVMGRTQLLSLFAEEEQDPEVLAQRYGTVVIVTDGPRGWELATPGGGRARGEALPVEAVDATGAGDCFCGVYLCGLQEGLSPEAAARRAAAAAGLACTVPGARGAPEREDIDRVLAGAGPAISPG